jgi:hypothetical protein
VTDEDAPKPRARRARPRTLDGRLAAVLLRAAGPAPAPTTPAPDAAWRPGERADAAARIVDGEARPATWQLVADATTDEDLDRARQLLEVVVDAVVAGDREVLDRLGETLRAVRGLEPEIELRRAAWVAWVRAMSEHWRSDRRPSPASLQAAAVAHDERFASLSPERFASAIASVREGTGRGSRGAVHVAAELALEAKALQLRGPIDGARETLRRSTRRGG